MISVWLEGGGEGWGGGGGGEPKPYTPYKMDLFTYPKSVQGEGARKHSSLCLRTLWMIPSLITWFVCLSIILSTNHCVSVIQSGHMSVSLTCLSAVLLVHFSLGPLSACKCVNHTVCQVGLSVVCLQIFHLIYLPLCLSVSLLVSQLLHLHPNLKHLFFIFGN